jgi:hypothetical protein
MEASEVNEPKAPFDPPILYWPRREPVPLSEDQVKGIGRAAKRWGQARDVWFVLVLRNNGSRATVSAYYVPDAQSPRVRRGMAFENIGGVRTLPYAQVSASDDPFEGRPVPPDDFALLPFALPDDFTDEELIEIVDFIRSPPPWSPRRLVGSDGRGVGFEFPVRVDPNDPIYRIRREGQTVIVEMGMIEGGLSGYMKVFTCEKLDGAWKITDTSRYLL